MRLILNEHITDPAGAQISEHTAAQILAKCMLVAESKTEEDVMNFYQWGFALAKHGEIEIEVKDAARIGKFILDQPQLSNIVKGYLLKKVFELK